MTMSDPTQETQQEFEKRYAAGPAMGGRVFGKDMVSMPCTCEDGGGSTHWCAVFNEPEFIESHLSHEEVLRELRGR